MPMPNLSQSDTISLSTSPTPTPATLSPATLAPSAIAPSVILTTATVSIFTTPITVFPTTTAFSAIAVIALLPLPLVARRQRLRRRRRTGATTVQATWRGRAARSHLRHRRYWAGAAAVQAAWRGRAARSALRDLHHICNQLRREPGDPPDICLGGGPTVDYCAGLVRPGLMDVYSRMDDEYIDIRGRQRNHRAELAGAALVMQSSFRGRLVRRCLLPATTLVSQILLSREMCRTPVDPASAVMADPAPAHLYLRRVEGGLSWVYCDRDTSFALVDALALLRPRPVRAGGRASNAAQRARQHAAFEKDMRDWRRWRRTTLAWHEVAEARGRLYRPRGDGRYDKGRYEAALESRATAPSPRAMALAAWRRAGRDEALFAPSWDVWWSDYAESKGFNDVVVGVYDDFDDHVPLGSEDESFGGCDAWSDEDESDFADLALAHGIIA
jgi:hypothetical protein